MPRAKRAEDSSKVKTEVATPEVAPQLPEKEPDAPPKPQPEGGPKRYKSPTTGFTIETF